MSLSLRSFAFAAVALPLALTAVPSLHLAGAAYDGVSIADCVRQARATAEKLAHLR